MDLHLILLLGAQVVFLHAKTEVEILPADDKQFWKAGENASVSCTIEGNFRNKKLIERLTFLYRKKDLRHSNRKIVTQINSTLIKLEIVEARRSDSGNYICCLQRKNRTQCRARSVTELVFGDEPARPVLVPVNCTSYNMEYMICRINIGKTEKDLGNIPTSWNILWNVSFSYSGDYKKCDRIEHESERIIICLIKDNFLPKTLYTIKVEAKNRIGNTSIQTLVDPWYLVKPNITDFYLESDKSGVLLRWPSPLECFDKTLLFIILYSTSWEKDSCNCGANVTSSTISVPLRNCHDKHSSISKRKNDLKSRMLHVPVPSCHGEHSVIHKATKCCISKTRLLKRLHRKRFIAGVEYTVSIVSRPLDGTGYFSDAVCSTVRTAIGVPTAAPVMHPWFYSIDCRHKPQTLVLYWKEIPIPQRGSKHITNYSVILGSRSVSVNGTTLCAVLPVSDTSLCSGRGLQSVSVKPATEAGSAHAISAIEVFSPARVPSKAVDVEKWISNNNTLHATWQFQPGSQPAGITRVHWCYGAFWKDTNLVQCQNEIHDREVVDSRTQISFSVPFSGNPDNCANCDWRIAVSMETHGISSGLIWEKNPQLPDTKKIFVSDRHTAWIEISASIGGVLLVFCFGAICYKCKKIMAMPKVLYPNYSFTKLETQSEDEIKIMKTKNLPDESIENARDKNGEKLVNKDSGLNSSLLSSSRDRKSHISNGSHLSSFAKITSRHSSYSLPDLRNKWARVSQAVSVPHLNNLIKYKRTTRCSHAVCARGSAVCFICDGNTTSDNERFSEFENSFSGISQSHLLDIPDSSASGMCESHPVPMQYDNSFSISENHREGSISAVSQSSLLSISDSSASGVSEIPDSSVPVSAGDLSSELPDSACSDNSNVELTVLGYPELKVGLPDNKTSRTSETKFI